MGCILCTDLPPDKQPLDWNTRVKIAVGAGKGLTYLHEVANPPVIYRDMKAGNILLDNNFHPKLSDFGLAKLGPVGDKTHVSTRVMGTYGYCAPDYAMSGKLTTKSDVYSFGVLLLELLTGRRAFDSSKIRAERNLLTWVSRYATVAISVHIFMHTRINLCRYMHRHACPCKPTYQFACIFLRFKVGVQLGFILLLQ